MIGTLGEVFSSLVRRYTGTLHEPSKANGEYSDHLQEERT